MNCLNEEFSDSVDVFDSAKQGSELRVVLG